MYQQKIKNLFLIDGIGALISAFLLGIVLPRFQVMFGIPKSSLYILAIIPCFFLVYDAYCFLSKERHIGFYLRLIAFANVLYCLLSIIIAFFHSDKLTLLGWGYIIGEISIILGLVLIELRAASNDEIVRPSS